MVHILLQSSKVPEFESYDPFTSAYPGYVTIRRFADLAAEHLGGHWLGGWQRTLDLDWIVPAIDTIRSRIACKMGGGTQSGSATDPAALKGCATDTSPNTGWDLERRARMTRRRARGDTRWRSISWRKASRGSAAPAHAC
jgi:hypothetical protein